MSLARRTLYAGGALVAVVLLLTGARLSTALTVALVTFMIGMHLGGHGHGAHAAASSDEPQAPRPR